MVFPKCGRNIVFSKKRQGKYSFFKWFFYLCNVCIRTGSPQRAEDGQVYILIKAFLYAFVLTCRNLAVRTQFVKNKAMQNASWGVLYTALLGFSRFIGCCQGSSYILTLAWGFRRCSFRQIGQCQSLYTWNGRQNRLHAFSYVQESKFRQQRSPLTAVVNGICMNMEPPHLIFPLPDIPCEEIRANKQIPPCVSDSEG